METTDPREQRRVAGVLVEKAKTTPSGYPLSLNAVTTGSNQKSNRHPQMELTPQQAEDALDALRDAGAVGEVHGDGRVAKYRHYMKDWLGVDGTELAVMAELLLRGAQSVGELRGRAARMAGKTLPDVSSLRPVLQSLIEKGLVIALTPAGRGQVVTHALYQERELEKVRSQFSGAGTDVAAGGAPATPSRSTSTPSSRPAPAQPTAPSPTPATAGGGDEVAALRAEVQSLRDEMTRIKKEIEDIWSNLS